MPRYRIVIEAICDDVQELTDVLEDVAMTILDHPSETYYSETTMSYNIEVTK